MTVNDGLLRWKSNVEKQNIKFMSDQVMYYLDVFAKLFECSQKIS